ncbi:MAG: class I SAM-dependent methyltransferase [Micrococcales bacterium]|nr:class I SAM-dependent methyltransferase [Micrococcales bacterium]
MHGDMAANWAFAEDFRPLGEPALRARDRASELGLAAPSPGACALITVLTAAVGAKSAVDIGTGAGIGALAVLAGMPTGGVLTTIDAESEHLDAARAAFAEAEIPAGATRLINSRPLEVLPRLADAAYDLVLLNATGAHDTDRLEDALRILRVGGVLVVNGAFGFGRVPDPALRDPGTTSVRELVRAVRGLEGFALTLVPAGDGVLVAVRQ